MGFFTYNLLFSAFTFLSTKFSGFTSTFNVLLVVFSCLSAVTDTSFSLRSTVTRDLIGSHHVTKISFLDFQDTATQQPTITQFHVTLTYEIFLRSGVNLEGNNNQSSFKFRTRHDLEYTIQHNYARPRDFRGSNVMFNTYKSSFFFFLSTDIVAPRIVTNHPGLKPIKLSSSSSRPNFNFIVANFISGIMRFLNWVDAPDKDKIFAKIRRHLLIQHKALDARKSSQAPNLNQTKTFFRFSHKKQTVYFGFYLPCQSHSSCVTPCTKS